MLISPLISNNIYFQGNKPLYNGHKITGAYYVKEDYFAKSRNGHPLRDTYDGQTNSLDIWSSGLYPSNVLSNLSFKPFVFDEVQCSSMEGLLQSFKTPDIEQQKLICRLHGGSARKMSAKFKNWSKTQKLYWNGKEYDRSSKEYRELLYRAYESCYEQNEIFKNALNATKGMRLTHTNGGTDKKSTVLTQEEFTDILTELRDKN